MKRCFIRLQAMLLAVILSGTLCFPAFASADSGTDNEQTEIEQKVPIEKLELNLQSRTLSIGDTIEDLYASITPDISSYPAEDIAASLVWSSDDPSIATVQSKGWISAQVKAVSPGTTNIHVKSLDGKVEAVCTITVSGIVLRQQNGQPIPNNTIHTTPTASVTVIRVAYGDALTFSASEFEWTSADTTIARVSNTGGTITGISAGTTTITCSFRNYSASCTVVVDVGNFPTTTASLTDGVLRFSDIIYKIRENNLYITGLSVSPSVGTLYYRYVSEADTGPGVANSDIYYFSGTEGRLVEYITFIPKSDYTGEAVINYTGFSASGAVSNGRIILDLKAAGSGSGSSGGSSSGVSLGLSYSCENTKTFQFRADDFSRYSQEINGRSANHVMFTLPPARYGKLYYNYISPEVFESEVSAYTRYYSTGLPAIDNITFVPAENYVGSFDMAFSGYDSGGNPFSGKIRINVTGLHNPSSSPGSSADVVIQYNTTPGKRIYFDVRDFSNASFDQTDYQISYIRLQSIPSTSRGTLACDGREITSIYVSYYRTSSGSLSSSSSRRLIDSISYQPNVNANSGYITIPFVGYATNGKSFDGEIIINIRDEDTVNDNFGNISYFLGSVSYTSFGSAVTFNLADFLPMTRGRNLLSLRFIPPASEIGKLYLDFVTPVNRTAFDTMHDYSLTEINRISFLPKHNFNGVARINFTAKDVSGTQYSGAVQVNVIAPTTSVYYADMGNHVWAIPSVEFLREYKISIGTSATTFSPAGNMRKGDFILMLSRAFSFADVGKTSFLDVPRDSYYASAIASAKALGIINADQRGYCYPNATITRLEAAIFLYRCLTLSGMALPGNFEDLRIFSDVGQIPESAWPAVGSLVRSGVFVGGTDGMFHPNAALNRAQMAAILHRALTTF